jgi:hypothetical protein
MTRRSTRVAYERYKKAGRVVSASTAVLAVGSSGGRFEWPAGANGAVRPVPALVLVALVVGAGVAVPAGGATLADATVRITDVLPDEGADPTAAATVPAGETVIVTGITNLQPDENLLVVELRRAGAGGAVVAVAETSTWGRDGEWAVVFDPPETGSYVVRAEAAGASDSVRVDVRARPTPTETTPTATPAATATATATTTATATATTAAPTATRSPTGTPPVPDAPDPLDPVAIGLLLAAAAGLALALALGVDARRD